MTDKRIPPPSNSVRIWMPIYIGDYLADTIGFSNSEHGAYFLSMLAYWRKGESLTERELSTITGKDFDRISEFFVFVDNRWHHKRIDIELVIANDKVLAMKAKAAKGVAARRAMGQLPNEPHG